MPSLRPEILVDLFRRDGQLAVELRRRCAGIAIDHARVAVGSIDPSQVAPIVIDFDDVPCVRDRDRTPEQACSPRNPYRTSKIS